MASKHPAFNAHEEERTTVDPGGLDQWQDERTVADSPSTGTTDIRPSDDGDSVVLVNRAPNGTESETVDELTIEEHRQSHVAPKQPLAARAKMPNAALMVRTGPHEGESFKLSKPVVTVGRALGNDIVLIDRSISKKHLKIVFDGEQFWLQDLGSGNGTVVNGRDEDDVYRLSNRDALELGRSIITFECATMEAKAPVVSPPKPRGNTARPPAGKRGPGAPDAPPTVSMRSEKVPALEEFDVDDEASTVVGQRPPGPKQLPVSSKAPPKKRPAAPPSGLRRPEEARDLVMPRDPKAGASARMTMPSPAVPAPRSEPPRVVRQQTPIPIDVDLDEEPTSAAAPPRRPMRPMPSSQPPPASQPPRAASMPSQPPRAASMPSHPPAVVYPSAPQQFNRSGAVVALSPRGPNQIGLMREAPRRSGNKKWVAGIALLAVATIVGVTVAALSGGGGESSAAPAEPETPSENGTADGSGEGTAANAGTSDGTASGTAATNGTSDGTASGTAATNVGTSDGTSDGTGAGTNDTGTGNGSATAASGTNGTSNGTADGTGAGSGSAPVVSKLADAGPTVATAVLPQTTWGTSEDVLVTLPQEPLVLPKDTPETPTAPDTNTDETDEAAKKAAEEAARKKAAEEAAKKAADAKDTTDSADDAKAIAAFIRGRKSRAAAAYRDRNFSRASSLMTAASKKAKRREAKRLRRTAANYAEMGRLLRTAKNQANSNPIVSFNKYKRAKSLDRKLGRKHQKFINTRILIVGPKAAQKYMISKDYASAARAVSLSRAAGDRARTNRVMSSLEKKAKELIKKGKAAKRAGKKSEAKSQFSQAKRMLPTQSKLYGEVNGLLKSVR